jgi:hypothetical protein
MLTLIFETTLLDYPKMDWWRRNFIPATSFVMTCKQVYYEAYPILYANNSFYSQRLERAHRIARRASSRINHIRLELGSQSFQGLGGSDLQFAPGTLCFQVLKEIDSFDPKQGDRSIPHKVASWYDRVLNQKDGQLSINFDTTLSFELRFHGSERFISKRGNAAPRFVQAVWKRIEGISMEIGLMSRDRIDYHVASLGINTPTFSHIPLNDLRGRRSFWTMNFGGKKFKLDFEVSPGGWAELGEVVFHIRVAGE